MESAKAENKARGVVAKGRRGEDIEGARAGQERKMPIL